MRTTVKIFIAIAAISLSACGSAKVETNQSKDESTLQQVTSTIAKDVTIAEFKELILKGGIILDVRTPNEFNEGHLENAININFYDPNFKTEIAKLDRTKTILVYCRSGGRSAKSMNIMKDNGFQTVYNMLGGYSSWSK